MATNGRDSPAPKSVEEKGDETPVSLQSDPLRLNAAPSEILFHITSFIAKSILPNLRRFLVENDKIIAACNNIVYYVVNPALRGKTRYGMLTFLPENDVETASRPMDVEPTVVSIIAEMSRIPAALKSWRAVVIDLLSDNRVFNSDRDDGDKWKPIVKALYNSDKAALTELLGLSSPLVFIQYAHT